MKKDKINLFIISIVFLIFSIFLYGKCGNFLIDFSRESYIPFQINNNEILVKDILLIYGAFGYIFNAFLYKIFFNINTLLVEALIISYFISIIFYYILKKFTNEKTALIFSVLFVSVNVFSNSTFSFILPYSYSVLWGIFGIYLVLYSILYQKNKLLFFSLGLIFASRIEFFIVTFLISLYFIIKNKSFKFKDSLFFFIIPLIPLFYFIFNKVNLSDLIENFLIIKKMVSTVAIKNLYCAMGSYFSFGYFKLNFLNSLIFLILNTILYFIFKKQKILFFILLIIAYFFLKPIIALNLGFIFSSILTLFLIKKLNKNEILLFLFCFIFSSKSVFTLNPYDYSNFGWSLNIFYIYFLLKNHFNLDKNFLNYILIALLININIINLIHNINDKKLPLKTNIGNIYLKEKDYFIAKEVTDFIKNNITENQDFIVLPEGQIFNLIYQKPWKFKNSTFTPLDFETFEDKNLIQKLDENKTNFLIFYPRNTSDYGFSTICYDYGIDFCEYVANNYSRVKIIDKGYKTLIFKLRKKWKKKKQ